MLALLPTANANAIVGPVTELTISGRIHDSARQIEID
jgi:hypothetical protein